MSISKESVVEALKQVLYFPKGDNVIALNMISEIKVSGKKVSFSINFDAKDEKSENVVKDSCIKTIKKELKVSQKETLN